ncbi:MAG: hydrogenase maturation nickel metallochaperone HypA [Bryobacteraceae bacterium]
MHELSIALSIVEMAEEESERQGGARVTAVHLKLGPLSGVVKAALESAFGLACEGTILEGARLQVEEVPIVGFCKRCHVERTLPSMQWFVCPECAGPIEDVLRGRELEVIALELEELEVPR